MKLLESLTAQRTDQMKIKNTETAANEQPC